MKAFFILIFALILINTCRSSLEIKVPDSIQKAFQEIHLDATEVKWIQEPYIYEAKSTEVSLYGTVSFNENGNVIETEEVIKLEHIQTAGLVDLYIHDHYPAEHIERC